ncbi:MAG: VWA domain-containing protein [Myxococcaceae bacterium]
MTRAIRIELTAVTLVVAAVSLSCTDAFIEPTRTEPSQVDNRLELNGRVCTDPPNPNGFPVKVVIVIDQSGSMCVSDPPGSQGGGGFCQKAEVTGIIPPGVTEPARVRALRELINQFRTQPNVQVAIAPFETNVVNTWPTTTTGSRFAPPDSSLDVYISGLQGQLGKGTDYQGAMAYAYGLIASDINQTALSDPELLPRTRYVVVFLSDGTPYPRCSANDNLTEYAGPDTPWGIWKDFYDPFNNSAQHFCNMLDDDGRGNNYTGADEIVSFVPGTDRNQNRQIFSYVDQLMELKQQFNIGDLRLHSILLFNERAVQSCGPACQEIYGQYDGVDPVDFPRAAKKIASWTMQQMALRGNGIYQEFTDGDIGQMSLGALDYSSLASPFVMKTLMVENVRSVPGSDGPKVDSDGDGLPDEVDNTFTSGTNSYFADTDGDCFDDRFETIRSGEGFVAGNQKDVRGCDPDSPLTLDCSCSDTDGDGLSHYAEAYLGSRTGMGDSDGDGIPDGVEARYGLDVKLRAAAGIDTDGDGIPDLDEIRAGSDPTRKDRAYYERFGHQYEVRAEEQADGSICYDFTVKNLHLVTPPNRAGEQQGYNLFKLYFAEAPASGIGTDYGKWRTACAWAQYNPPSVRVPSGPDLTLTNGDFGDPNRMAVPDYFKTGCVGIAP